VVLGVSPDSPAKHRKFKAKFELPFTLIADTDHAVSEAYGVWVEKSIMGKKYMGIARTTFIIDRDGRIAKVFEKVNPLGHAAQVAEAIEGMRAPA
jgi:peroxiredoxin Q/BCP